MRTFPSQAARRTFSLRPTLMAAAVVACLHGHAWAIEPFVLKDIRVEGLQRTDVGTVFATLPFRVGDSYNDGKGAAAVRALFATGFFKDVRIEIEGNVVVVIVDERSVVANIDFVGLKEFEKDVLIKSLKDFGVAEGMPFDKALADRAEQELKRQYLARSLYGAEVVTTVTPQERNRVNLTFSINEGASAKISEIRIVGNKAFSESTLKGLFDLNDGGWLNWYTKGDRYSRAKLTADLEVLRAHYLNRGYLEFAVESTQVAISADKQNITLTIQVKEGQPYTVTAVKLEGDYLGKEDDFKALVKVEVGEPYQAEAVATTTKSFTDRFGNFGFAFARVDARTELDKEKGQVVLTLVADPQRRVYVRRINVAGNSTTRDEVIRREFRQFESAWYDGRRIKLSRERVERLGYFSDVGIDTVEVPGTQDQVDLTMTVAEKPTGSLMLGAGYSSADKFSINGSIKKENVFGTGTYLGIELNTSKSNRNLVFSSVDPYYTIDGISRAFDVYYRTNKPINSQGEDYKLVTPGASVRFGVPFTEYDTVFLGLGAEQTEIQGSLGLPMAYRVYIAQYGARSLYVPITLGWARDDRDSVVMPNQGSFRRVNVDWSAAGDVQYLRTNLQYQHYWPITKKFTFGVNGEIGWGQGLGGKDYPIFKNFYGGGLGSVRAFDQGSLGMVDPGGAYLGGARRINLNSELYLPVPGTGTDRTLRLFTYLDVGNVWGEREKVLAADLRASAGIGLSWVSPIGPLKLSYGNPIRYQPSDRISKFQFQIGTSF